MEAFGGGGMYSSYSFLTSALDGGELSASRPGRALPPGKGPPVPIEQKAGWDPEPVWTQGLEEKSSTPVKDRPPIVQPVVRHYTDWTTPAPLRYVGYVFCDIVVLRVTNDVNSRRREKSSAYVFIDRK
jgi:hypothetical protein